MSDFPKPRFTGIFIPVEILELKTLSFFAMLLLSWIDALYSEDHGGCFASNDYLAQKLNVEANTVAKELTNFRKMGLIEDVSFDGRTRVIKAKINDYVNKRQSKSAMDQSKSELDKSPSSIGEKSIPPLDKSPSTPLRTYNIEESKEDIKERKNIAQNDKNRSKPQSDSLNFSNESKKIEGITEEDFQSWKVAYPLIEHRQEITKAEQWLIANPSRANKKKWRKFLLTWFSRASEVAERKQTYQVAGSGKSELAQQLQWKNDNTSLVRKGFQEISDLSHEFSIQGDFVVQKSSHKELSLKMQPEAFKLAFYAIAGLED